MFVPEVLNVKKRGNHRYSIENLKEHQVLVLLLFLKLTSSMLLRQLRFFCLLQAISIILYSLHIIFKIKESWTGKLKAIA